MEDTAIQNINITKVSKTGNTTSNDVLAVEEPLEIGITYQQSGKKITKSISVTMRTPGNDDELAAGFLFTEGIINSKAQIEKITLSMFDENRVTLVMAQNSLPRLQTAERNFYTTSSCGVCGKASIDSIKTVSKYQDLKDGISVSGALFFELPDELKKQQQLFKNTGGLHASALFDLSGKFIMLREDVGRHNALDKVIGASLLHHDLPLQNSILLLSGRASFELIQKAYMAGIKIVASIGAPSSLAFQLAQDCDITLIGFLADEKYNIYTGAQRISSVF